jgi:hypothetical protein
MRWKTSLAICLVYLCLFGLQCFGQVAPSATASNGMPFRVGAGFSDFRTSFGHGTIKGGTLWLDYTPTLPHFLNGLGIEAELRDLSLAPPSTTPIYRFDEAEGGVVYSWHHFSKVVPYGKALFGYGNVDYKLNGARYHDSRTITVLGGGLEYRVYKSVWARADYQYQIWPDYWKNSNPAQSLTPSGFTFGTMYDFRRTR